MDIYILCIFAALIRINAYADTSTSSWRVTEHRYITSFLNVTSARSRLDCVRTCSKFSQCVVCAFERTSGTTKTNSEGKKTKTKTSGMVTDPGTCYLMPSINSVPEKPSSSITILSRQTHDNLCKETKALAVANGHVTSWRRTLTSLEGQVLCDEDYMFAGRDPMMRCVDSNHWQPLDGHCAQKVWRFEVPVILQTQDRMEMAVPKPVTVGWSLCMNATALDYTRVALNLQTDSYKALFHLDARFNYEGSSNTLVLDSNYSGPWGTHRGEKLTPTPFPLAPWTPFTLTITAVRHSALQIELNGEAGSWSKGPKSLPAEVEEITRVTIFGDVSIHLLDLWCQ